MPISVECPHCGEQFSAPDEYAGRTTKCRQCDAELKLPGKPIAPPKKNSTLITCRDCGREVSSSASTCPGCGATSPAVSTALYRIAVGIGVVVFLVVFAIVFGGFRGCVNQLAAPGDVDLSEFNQITTGMTYREVVSIIGTEGTELSRVSLAGTVTVMYKWDGQGIANMNAMFQNGKLITKSQFGLE